MMKLQNLTALLTALLCLTAVVSCGEAAEAPAPETESVNVPAETAETGEPGYPAPDFSALDFGGDTLHMISPDWNTASFNFTDAEDGDSLNDAIYARMRNVESAVNVKIEYQWVSSQDIHSMVKNSVSAGDDAYDIIFTHSIYGIGDMAIDNVLYNLDDLSNLNFDAPWWNRDMIDQFRIGRKTIYAYGDIIIPNPGAMYFNKQIVTDYDLPDQYQLVRDGKWTYDTFLSEAKMISQDVNGDSVIDENDLVGLSGDLQDTVSYLLYSIGERCTNVTENGLELVYYNEKTLDAYNKLYDLYTDKAHSQAYMRSNGSGQDFDAGLSLFTIKGILSMAGLRESSIDFGVLPLPKWDEAQKEYITYANSRFVCVPTTITRPELVGASLEQFAYESTNVKNEYFETLIRGKSSRDVESLEMLDIITSNLTCDVGANYLGFDEQFNKIFYGFKVMLAQNTKDFTSFYQKTEKSVLKVIDKLYADVIAAEES